VAGASELARCAVEATVAASIGLVLAEVARRTLGEGIAIPGLELASLTAGADTLRRGTACRADHAGITCATSAALSGTCVRLVLACRARRARVAIEVCAREALRVRLAAAADVTAAAASIAAAAATDVAAAAAANIAAAAAANIAAAATVGGAVDGGSGRGVPVDGHRAGDGLSHAVGRLVQAAGACVVRARVLQVECSTVGVRLAQRLALGDGVARGVAERLEDW
jgi:hypothetical protein